MFKTILHANDGSKPAFKALDLAIAVARQNTAALHLVCVEEIPPMPEYIEEIREAKGIAARRFHPIVERARLQAEQSRVKMQVHVVSGHPVRIIVDLVDEIRADRTFRIVRAHGWQPCRPHRSARGLSGIGRQVNGTSATEGASSSILNSYNSITNANRCVFAIAA
jgi:nucleotide-binding universal stress UspA family protein